MESKIVFFILLTVLSLNITYQISVETQKGFQTSQSARILATENVCFSKASASQIESIAGEAKSSLNLSPLSVVKSVLMNYDQFNKQFKTTVEKDSSLFFYRAQIFVRNLQTINTHNLNSKRGYNLGINFFADIQQSEFIAKYSKLIIPDQLKNQNIKIKSSAVSISAAARQASVYTTPPNIVIDWSCRASPVVNQGVCGSCFVIAPLESIYITAKIYAQNLLPLSFQEVLSCSLGNSASFGCNGGYFTSVYNYTQINGTGRAIMYPYNTQASSQGTVTACNKTLINSSAYQNSKFKIRSSSYIPYRDCSAMVNTLKTQAIAVAISTVGLQFYVSGTFNEQGELNHGVTLVGYNPSKGYRIKNSWGVAWGELGYGWVSESTGICDYAMYPLTGFQGLDMGSCC